MEDIHGNEHDESNGQFTSNGSTEAENKRADELTGNNTERDNVAEEKRLTEVRKDLPSPKGKNKSEVEFFGVEYKGIKGENAIEKLLKEKQGHIKNAFERPEIGGIDVAWGDKNGGLQHVILRRDKRFAEGKGKISGLEMVRKIPDIIERGEFSIDVLGRPLIELGDYRVAVKPTYDGKKINWVISAMEIEKSEDN